jgi:voltage-gated potassium channel
MPEPKTPTKPKYRRRRRTLIRSNNRFRVLLTFLALMLMVTPFFEERRFAINIIRLILSLALIAAVYGVSRKRRDLIIAGTLALPALIGRWLPAYATSMPIFAAVSASTALFLAFVAYMIINEVAHLRTVTFDTIFGAACGYILIGAVWAFTYSLINVVAHPGFVFTDVVNLPPAPDLIQQSRLTSLFYFSFITLTSTGFGDILPLAPVAKGFAVVEAMIGQFYVAILVARLVSLELLSSGNEADPNPDD